MHFDGVITLITDPSSLDITRNHSADIDLGITLFVNLHISVFTSALNEEDR